MKYTKQETFDTVVSWLRVQGRQAISFTGEMAMRGIGGTRCAVGVLIPDNLYNSGWEGNWSNDHVRLMEDLGHDPGLCLHLMQAHDGYDPCQWEIKWLQIASLHKLVYTKPIVKGPLDERRLPVLPQGCTH